MKNQQELLFPVLPTGEVSRLLNPDDPACPFHTYVGNRDAVDMGLDLAYSAFSQRCKWRQGNNAEACNRVCAKNYALVGAPSCGKTDYARRLARLINIPYCETSGEMIGKKADLFEALQAAYKARGLPLVPEDEVGGVDHYKLPPGILFIDEVHRMKGTAQDGLLKATEPKDSTLILKGATVCFRQLCVLIGTTDWGMLRAAFKTRFTTIEFQRHTAAEVARIVAINQPAWTPADCAAVAALKPVPRQAIKFSELVNLLVARRGGGVTEGIKEMARREGIRADGLPRTAFATLQLLRDAPNGLSRASLCASLGIEEEEFVHDYLPHLVANGNHPAYLTIAQRHLITEEGRKYLAS